MSELKRLSQAKNFDGSVEFYSHFSESCGVDMRFSVFVPPQAKTSRVPILYWLSGLTCTEENFMIKAGAQRYAARQGFLLVCPDTSPRGANIPGESEHWDFGLGAGFYVNATEPPWARNYRMDDYVSKELPELIHQNFSVDPLRESIFGHSMGGHGALVLALRNPNRYRSVSAFAPICAPSQCPWGEKAFTRYLGPDRTQWAQYDANELVKSASKALPLLVDQGLADPFLSTQLSTDLFENTCREKGVPLTLRRHEGYDHNFYFISTFVEDHFNYHADFLKN